MRLFTALLGNGRRPQTEPLPYKEIMPMKLRMCVSGKGDKFKNPACLFEMSIVFACLKQNDFSEGACSSEISSFKKCFVENETEKRVKKADSLKGQLTPGQHKMGYKQINQILKKFPPHYKSASRA